MKSVLRITLLLCLFISALSCEKNNDFDHFLEEEALGSWELIATYIEGQDTLYMIETEEGSHYKFSNDGTFTSNHSEGTNSGYFYMEANNLILTSTTTTDLTKNNETPALSLAGSTVITVDGQHYIHKKALNI